MKEKVVFDTNIIHNPDIAYLFGGRKELERFKENADIVIPETVLQEIKRHKRQKLLGNKRKFLDNPLHKILEIDETITNDFNVDDYIEKLIEEESFKFEVIDVKDNNVLPLIKNLALNKKAPFESGDNTDKGFKDALIYFSILEYINEIPNKYIFVCVKDGRLKEALDSHQNIIVIESYDEFKQKSISQFFDDYFVQKINEYLNLEIEKNSIKQYWYNLNDNQAVLIEHENEEYVIEVDSGEIISAAFREEYSSEIQKLISSENFNSTDKRIDFLQPYAQFFSLEEIKRILEAAWDNTQIRWIIEKDAIKEFIGPLYLANKDLIEGQHQEFLKETFE